MSHRLVHLDLKGAPPKPNFLKKLYPQLVRWGATGILLEWEDCFPYKSNLKDICNRIYTFEEASQIVNDAKQAKLEVIPLVQSFGHLEFLLKHKKYAKLREVPLFPSSICPSNPDSLPIVTSMLEQVIQFHIGVKYIHIGADEVWHMGFCDDCRVRLSNGESKEDLFLKYLKKVIDAVKNKWPELRIIMWDDMLRGMEDATLHSYNLKSVVEPMVWHYRPASSFCLPTDLFTKYAYFDRLWVGAAFKGATGGSQLIPVDSHHVSNVLKWVHVMSELKSQCCGIVLTGWSRYDHFAAMCELLPVSLVSLGVCLSILEEKCLNPTIQGRIEAELGQPGSGQAPEVEDPAWHVYNGVFRFMQLKLSAQETLHGDQLQTWMNDWHIARGNLNPMHLVPLVPQLAGYLRQLDELEKYLIEYMEQIYHQNIVEEWVGTNIVTLRNKIQKVLELAEGELSRATRLVEERLMEEKVLAVDKMDC